MEDELDTNPEYVHTKECKNGYLITGKLMIQL